MLQYNISGSGDYTAPDRLQEIKERFNLECIDWYATSYAKFKTTEKALDKHHYIEDISWLINELEMARNECSRLQISAAATTITAAWATNFNQDTKRDGG